MFFQGTGSSLLVRSTKGTLFDCPSWRPWLRAKGTEYWAPKSSWSRQQNSSGLSNTHAPFETPMSGIGHTSKIWMTRCSRDHKSQICVLRNEIILGSLMVFLISALFLVAVSLYLCIYIHIHTTTLKTWTRCLTARAWHFWRHIEKRTNQWWTRLLCWTTKVGRSRKVSQMSPPRNNFHSMWYVAGQPFARTWLSCKGLFFVLYKSMVAILAEEEIWGVCKL